jgi:FKBP-type peptidyl-prolyl cis-trans isomerase SlyD
MVVTVTEITDDSVTIDANHPMAGKKLIFGIEILNVD